MSLQLGDLHAAAIRRHGEETYPHECCGFLLGRARGESKETVRLRPARNEREDSARNRYLISPEAYLEAEKQADREGLEIVGFYHSHPDAEARPSEFDRSHALPWCSYVIVSVREGTARDLRSWILSGETRQFTPEEIV
jgi:proteasome lid subunit RPN8/RPN11